MSRPGAKVLRFAPSPSSKCAILTRLGSKTGSKRRDPGQGSREYNGRLLQTSGWSAEGASLVVLVDRNSDLVVLGHDCVQELVRAEGSWVPPVADAGGGGTVRGLLRGICKGFIPDRRRAEEAGGAAPAEPQLVLVDLAQRHCCHQLITQPLQ